MATAGRCSPTTRRWPSRLRSLRQHGEGRDRYDNVRIGVNSRLDSLQAAVLLAKLSIFAEEIEQRQRIAARYSEALADLVEVTAGGQLRPARSGPNTPSSLPTATRCRRR